MLFRSQGASFGFSRNEWKNLGVTASPYLVGSAGLELPVFIKLAEFAVLSRSLGESAGDSFPELTENIIISLLGLLNRLAQSEDVRKLLLVAA